ncbi:IclR family transcriptional regulator [Peribacillus sp. NPDC058002]|uniref:IclR family transcriptional regulator n=1 Tax=Peribacillus sp. NPDC058002 TaxID=3346301 RepID=UPI0036D84887
MKERWFPIKQYEVSTLKKGLLILDALRQEEQMTLSHLMTKFSLNKSTTFRLLYTLELMGYVKKVDHVYSLTNKAGMQFNPYNSRLNWLSVPPLYQLSTEVEETAYIGILDGTDVVTAQVIDGTHSIRAHSEVGERSPVHLSALGKVILAFLEKTQLEKILNELILVKNTNNTFVDLHLLKEHLKVILHQGYAIDDEETELGLRCIAAPIISEGNVISAVALSGPSTRLNKKLDKTISKKLIKCSAQISKML